MIRGANYAALNSRQKRFVDQIMQGQSQTQAAVKAGYSPRSAEQQGHALMRNPKVEAALREVRGPEIATVDEVQRYWTQVMRGEIDPAKIPTSDPLARSLKASELIAKSRGMFVHRVEVTEAAQQAQAADISQWPLELAEAYAALCEEFAGREALLIAQARAAIEP